jgi:hypothetical protein
MLKRVDEAALGMAAQQFAAEFAAEFAAGYGLGDAEDGGRDTGGRCACSHQHRGSQCRAHPGHTGTLQPSYTVTTA